MTRAEDKTVLVVDDEPNVRDCLANLLRDGGFHVLTAGDAHEALEIIRTKKPGFISLDLVMPRKSGHMLLFELQKDKELAKIPVLIVTAHAQDEMGQSDLEDIMRTMPAPVSTIRKEPVDQGQTLYLEKPVNRLDYVRCVHRMLGIEEAKEEAEKITLKEELEKQLRTADPDALRRALEALGGETFLPRLGAHRAGCSFDSLRGASRKSTMAEPKTKILVLDDEPDVVTYLETVLADNGYETISASDGKKGMEKVRKDKPDLVSLDISMPEASGARFYKEMKQDPELAKIPIVIITAITGLDGDPYAYKKFLDGLRTLPHPEGFLPKLIDREELLKTIRTLLA